MTNTLSSHKLLAMGIIWALAGLIFYSDLQTPLGFAHGILYTPVLILAMILTGPGSSFRRLVLWVSVIAVILGYFISPHASDLSENYIISNRLLSIAVLILVYVYGQRIGTIRQQNADILKLEQSLRQTFNEFVDAMPVQVWMANAEGVVDFVCSSLETFTGKPREVIVSHWLEFLHPDDRERTIAVWSQSVQSGNPYQTNFRLQRHDGKYVWFQTQAICQRDEHGQILRWLGSSMDIDDLLRYRQETERLATRYRLTVESISDAFFTLDQDFRFTYLNDKAAEFMGGTPTELAGEVIWKECSIGYNSPFAVQYRHAAESGQTLHFEEYFSTKDRWLDVHVYPSPEGLTVYFADITERRREQEQLQLLSTAVSRLNDMVMITEADSLDEPGPKTVFVNEAFEKLTGYSAQEIIGRSPRLLQGPKTDRNELDRIKTALRKNKPVRAQLVNYTKTGKEYSVELEIVPLLNDEGLCTHLVAVERDISERLEMEQRLRESQKLEAVGHLTGGVAHDFNNLLTVILGNAEMMANMDSAPQIRPMARMILSAAGRGAELTNRLLAFSRRQPLDPKPTNVNQLIEAMKELFLRTLPENIELVCSLAPDLGTTEIDANELDTALLNLVINARDAMAEGGKLTIETGNAILDQNYAKRHSEVTPGEYVMICVSDSGTGMSPETMSRAFEPFFTTKPAGKGSGLGLSMVFGFTKQSGGHIKVYSELDEGTAVKLYFPRIPDSAVTSYQPETQLVAQGGTEHILIAEDDDLVLQNLEMQLRSLGYRVTAVMSGPEALDILQEHNDIDLLLTDIIMPGGMNGRELADKARSIYPALRVLFSSGYTENAIVHHGRLDPGVDLLSKPYTRLELAIKVRQVLERNLV